MLFNSVFLASFALSASAADIQHAKRLFDLFGGGSSNKCAGDHNLLLNLDLGTTFDCPPRTPGGSGLGVPGLSGSGIGIPGLAGNGISIPAIGGSGIGGSFSPYGSTPFNPFSSTGGNFCATQNGGINVAVLNTYDCPIYNSSPSPFQPMSYQKEAKKHADKAKRADKGVSSEKDKENAKLFNLLGGWILGLHLKDAEKQKHAVDKAKRAEKGASQEKQDSKYILDLFDLLKLKDAEKNKSDKVVKRAETGASTNKEQDTGKFAKST